MDAFLAVEPADVGEDRLEFLAQKEAIAQRLLDGVFSLERFGSVMRGDQRIGLWVPDVVIDRR